LLCGDPSKAKRLLGWNPNKTSFADLIKKMVSADREYIK
jgi:GDPmannose 4,6-dehydratase